mmetsp:Transcript_4654/g.7367  ORF Transcript_4654/g.7367 Transcript_4654/m.7367 type:complete len:275 (+) Transcript_4654:1716-2540(+)
MGDAERQFGIEQDVLRGHAASPIDGHFAGLDLDRIAPIGVGQIVNADIRRIAKADGRTVGLRKPRADLPRVIHLRLRNGAHRDHHLARKRTRGHQVDVGAVHGHVAPALDVADRDALAQKRVFKGERTAQGDRHQIIPPQVRDIRHFVGQNPVPKDAVPGDVGANVDIIAKRRQKRIAAVTHPDHRAGLGIALAKAQEIQRVGFGQNGQIALQLACRQTRRVTAIGPTADRGAHCVRSRGHKVGMINRFWGHDRHFFVARQHSTDNLIHANYHS